jgi:hypothetical protein
MSPSREVREPEAALPGTVALAGFLDDVPRLPAAARYQLVEQARALLEGAYVHLALKRAMHAVDPVQRLRLLERRLPGLGDVEFHAELGAVFRSLRDLHTTYQLPDPYRGHVATLGFLVERYHDPDGRPHHLVTNADPVLEGGGFGAGAEVLSWSGVPIGRAVEVNAERQPGSNADARLARGLEALTLRSLRTGPPPDEHWVLLEYRSPAGRRHEVRLPWRVKPVATRGGRPQDPVSATSTTLGIDAGSEATREVKRALFAPGPARTAPASAWRSVMRHGVQRTGTRPLGYLRVFSFNVTSSRRFAERIAEVLAGLPPDGLIVDIRGNPGGQIPAAEAMLQLLSPRPIVPAGFSLATTPLALALCRANPAFAPWADSVRAAVETGEIYSQALPLSDPERTVRGLPRYAGPAVLITDALCYSAADIFAAGWQDAELGPVLGTHGCTGAGGANVWTHELLRLWLADDLGELPAGAGFRIALRRATRTNARAGVPLEDLGVRADAVHSLTRRDVTRRNGDLLAAAARLLDDGAGRDRVLAASAAGA